MSDLIEGVVFLPFSVWMAWTCIAAFRTRKIHAGDEDNKSKVYEEEKAPFMFWLMFVGSGVLAVMLAVGSVTKLLSYFHR